MPDISTTTVVLKEQELNLVLRPETKNWQIHYKIGASKTWHRKTSGTADLDEAKKIADDVYHEARVLDRRGLAIVSRKFKSVAEVVSKRFRDDVAAGTGKKVTQTTIVPSIATSSPSLETTTSIASHPLLSMTFIAGVKKKLAMNSKPAHKTITTLH